MHAKQVARRIRRNRRKVTVPITKNDLNKKRNSKRYEKYHMEFLGYLSPVRLELVFIFVNKDIIVTSVISHRCCVAIAYLCWLK